MEHDLLHQRRAAPAVLARPTQADPAVRAEQPLPLAPRLEPFVLATRAARVSEGGEVADEVLAEPVAHLGTKRLVLGREAQVHALYRNLTPCQKRCRP